MNTASKVCPGHTLRICLATGTVNSVNWTENNFRHIRVMVIGDSAKSQTILIEYLILTTFSVFLSHSPTTYEIRAVRHELLVTFAATCHKLNI